MAAPPVAGKGTPTGVLDPSVVRRWVERTCAAQSLPVHITHPQILAKLVTLLGVSSSPGAVAA